MPFEVIEYAVEDRVATITLDRPDALNAFTPQMADEVLAAMDRADADDEVRAVVVTGRGRAFCAGADLSGGAEIFQRRQGPFSMVEHEDEGGTMSLRFHRSLKPVIAAINGPAVGVGLTMTLPMDVRLASDSAKFGFVFCRRGLVPEAASSWFLPRVVGIQQAAEWVATGRVFDAQEALRGGLVRSVHPAHELLGAAYALAREIADNTSPVAVALARTMLWRGLSEPDPRTMHEVDSRLIHVMGASPDATEGVESFLERRPPAYPMKVSADMPDGFADWHAGGTWRDAQLEETRGG